MFEVSPDFGVQMLRLKVHGFWDDTTMAAYVAAVRATMADLQRSGGCRRILIDMSGYPIQPKPIAEGHAALLRASRQLPGVRVALVTQSALSRLQATRLAADAGHQVFDTALVAEAWLLADGG